MAFSVQVEGLDELVQSIDKLGDKALDMAALSLYKGAGVMADSVSQAVRGIVTEPFHYAKSGKTRKPSPEEKAIVASAKMGVAKFQKGGGDVQTSVGLKDSGYAMLKGKRKPIPQIANAINSGTSFMQQQPFFRKAVSKAKRPATEAIEREFIKQIEKMGIE